MIRLTELAHAAVRTVLQTGETAIDATAGNGHDTRFLCECVGPGGRVFAFDVQSEALARTKLTIGNASNVMLLQLDHAAMHEAVPLEHRGQISAIMFNLGYLPGGDKSVITKPESTVRAVSASLDLLRPGGVLTILAYSGHPGGMEEAEAVGNVLSQLPANEYNLREYRSESDSPSGPRLFVVQKLAKYLWGLNLDRPDLK